MLRPEQIALGRSEAVNGVDILARLLKAEIVGPAAIVTLGIAGDSPLKIRTSVVDLPPPGSAVSVKVIGSAHVFPADRGKEQLL